MNITSRNYIEYLSIALLVTLYVYLITIIPLGATPNFNSPDETSNYLATKIYADTGRMYYTSEFNGYDTENILHPRHFANYKGKTVFCQFFGLPLTYGTFYGFFGDYLEIIMAIIIGILALYYFVKICNLYKPNSEIYSIIVFLALSPLIYYFNHPYFNATPAIAFFIIGTYNLAKFSIGANYVHFYLSCIMYSVSILFRNNYALYIGLILLIFLFCKYKKDYSTIIKFGLILTTSVTVVALIPIFILNFETYGSILVHGNKVLFESIIRQTETPLAGNNLYTILFPSPVILSVIFKNILRLFVFLTPAITLLSLTSAPKIIHKIKNNPYVALFIIPVTYIICYRGSSNTYLAYAFDYVGFNTSIMRYWLILYFIVGILAFVGIESLSSFIGKKSTLLMLVLVMLSSINCILIAYPDSLIQKQVLLNELGGEADDVLKFYNKDKIIVYGRYADKIYSNHGVLVSNWWPQSDYYTADIISESMSKVQNRTGYTILFDNRGIDIKFIENVNNHLDHNGLVLAKTSTKDIYQLEYTNKAW